MGERFAVSLGNVDGNVTSIKFWRALEKMSSSGKVSLTYYTLHLIKDVPILDQRQQVNYSCYRNRNKGGQLTRSTKDLKLSEVSEVWNINCGNISKK